MKEKINITYIISNINKALAFEWIAASLNKEKFNLHFILLNSKESELEKYLKQNNFSVDRIKYRGKKDIINAIYSAYKILKRNKTTIVHTHLFEANIVGLTAAKYAGVRKRIHSRHHSDYHHNYYPKAVKYDRYVNRISTDIIAVSRVVKDILINKEGVKENKIHIIHHGFQLNGFINTSKHNINSLFKKYNSNNQHPVIGVISRYTEWKGIQYIIPAFKKIIEIYPDALLILANAQGDYKLEIKKHLQTIPERNYIEIDFENNIFALYKLFDVFIHVPINSEIEAFGQTYIEALAAGVPSVFTLSGIANEFISHEKNAIVVPYRDSDAIYNSVMELLNNKSKAKDLIETGRKDVNEMFGLDKMIISFEKLYGR